MDVLNTETRHPFAPYWDRGVRNVPDMTGARDLLDGRDLVTIFAALGMPARLASVLDVGCGTGRMAQFCDGYHGVDISPSMVEYCRRRNLTADLTVTPDDWPAGPFAWLTCISVCTHIDRPERQSLLDRASRLTANLLIDIIPGDGTGDVAKWTAVPEEFEADLRAAGFTIIGSTDHRWIDQTHRYYRCAVAR